MVFANNCCNMFDICKFIYMSHGKKKKMTPKSRGLLAYDNKNPRFGGGGMR